MYGVMGFKVVLTRALPIYFFAHLLYRKYHLATIYSVTAMTGGQTERRRITMKIAGHTASVRSAEELLQLDLHKKLSHQTCFLPRPKYFSRTSKFRSPLRIARSHAHLCFEQICRTRSCLNLHQNLTQRQKVGGDKLTTSLRCGRDFSFS